MKKKVRIEIKRRAQIEEKINNKSFDDSEHIFDEESDKNAACEELFDFKDELQNWAVKHRITKRASNDLLAILNRAGFGYLPRDSRTLMKTPVFVDICELSKGKLWYRGL